MLLADLPEVASLMLSAFAVGYVASWGFYVFRRVVWSSSTG